MLDIILGSKIMRWFVAIGAGTIAILAACAAIFRAGRKAEQAKQVEGRLEAVKQKKEVDDAVDQMGHSDVDRGLAEWMRDRKR